MPDTVASGPDRSGCAGRVINRKSAFWRKNHESSRYRAAALPAASAPHCLRRASSRRRRRRSAQSDDPIKIGFSMALTGPLAANGKQALLGAKIWEEEVNAKGGLLGRPVQAGLLRRSVQSGERARHLHQAARRRQSRPRRRPLCDQHRGAGHSGRHAEEQDLHRPVRARCQQRIPLSEIFLDAAVGADAEGILHRRLLPDRGGAKSEADRPSRSPPRTPSSRATPAKARATTSRNSASRSSTTKPIRRTRPTSRRSSAPCRRPIRIS